MKGLCRMAADALSGLQVFAICRPDKRSAIRRREELVQFLRAIQPVTFERTLHVFDSVDNVMVNIPFFSITL